jgi:prepilin-type N-terminal cleavage/methylation domain-containing protein
MPTLPRRRSSAAAPVRRSLGEGGFTLIELLTVIAIIGILIAIVVPTVGSMQKRAQRAVDGTNLREILKAAQVYASDNQDKFPDPQAINNTLLASTQLAWKWPGILAKNRILENSEFYFSKVDPATAQNVQPIAFIITPSAQRNQLHPSFTNNRSPSWEFIGGGRTSDHPMTPVIYTRGLMSNGTWSPTSGVYGTTGGYIAFNGGAVTFYPNLGTAQTSPLISNNPSSTSINHPIDIRQSIPLNGTAVSAASGRIYGIPPQGIGAGGMIGTANGALASRGQ